jgi:hypothetical protein
MQIQQLFTIVDEIGNADLVDRVSPRASLCADSSFPGGTPVTGAHSLVR